MNLVIGAGSGRYIDLERQPVTVFRAPPRIDQARPAEAIVYRHLELAGARPRVVVHVGMEGDGSSQTESIGARDSERESARRMKDDRPLAAAVDRHVPRLGASRAVGLRPPFE
jgi:hypothetical protein